MLLKSLYLLCCLILVQGAVVPEDAAPTVHILNNEQLEKFLLENPDAIQLIPEVSVQKSPARIEYDMYGLSWTLGSRKSGDSSVYTLYSPIQWLTELSNPQLTVRYPKSGEGKIVTYASVYVQQSSPLGTAYVTKGGIGQRSLEFYVVGYGTIFYGWDITIYGMN